MFVDRQISKVYFIWKDLEEKDFEMMSASEISDKGWDYQFENNLPMAMKCWTLAAELGDPLAQYSLGYNPHSHAMLKK